eukprot:3148864-Amphidinium_carterae.2
MDLNLWVRQWIPRSFRWNAIGLLQHSNVAMHVDRHNATRSIAVTLSSRSAWLQFVSPLNGKVTQVSMSRHPVCFNPTLRHAALAPTLAVTLVLYHTARAPRPQFLLSLVELGFKVIEDVNIPPAQPDSSASTHTSSPPSETTSDSDSDSSVDGSDSNQELSQVVELDDVVSMHCTDQVQPTDSEDNVPLTQLCVNIVNKGSPGRLFETTISPTLPFVQDVPGASLDLRGCGYTRRRAGRPNACDTKSLS